DQRRVRAVGSKWSMSSIAFVRDYLVNTSQLNRWMVGPFSKGMVMPAFADRTERLVIAQCGVQIRGLNDGLQQRGLALPTSGASNGQTIAGAVSTGTHGSNHDVGSMQEAVRGLHLVGERGEHYFIQPASLPVMTPAFASFLGAKLVEDD